MYNKRRKAEEILKTVYPTIHLSSSQSTHINTNFYLKYNKFFFVSNYFKMEL